MFTLRPLSLALLCTVYTAAATAQTPASSAPAAPAPTPAATATPNPSQSAPPTSAQATSAQATPAPTASAAPSSAPVPASESVPPAEAPVDTTGTSGPADPVAEPSATGELAVGGTAGELEHENKAKTEKKTKDADGKSSGSEDVGLFFSVGKATLGFGARVIAGWEYQVDELSDSERAANLRATEFGWFLSQARFTVDGNWDERVSMQLDLDFSDDEDPIRDAWLNYKLKREFQLRVGRFKRGYSRLELRGAGKIPLRGRGLANEHIVNDLGYGERSLGAELWGKIRALGVEWSLGASNPPPRYPGVDLHARLAYAPLRWLEFGGSAVHKITENAVTPNPDYIAGNGFGLDLKVNRGPLYILLDALLGENLGSQGLLEPDTRAVRQNAGSIGGYATYRIALPADWELEPMLFGEWVDTNLEYSRSEVARFVVGLNGLWRNEVYRVMPQLELIRPLHSDSEALWSRRDTFYVLLSGQL